MKSGMNNGFDLMALYGRNTVCSDKDGECRIYHLNNETGAGMITVYNVFTGISAAFNDIHMGYCSKKQNSVTSATLFSLNLINLSYALLPWTAPFASGYEEK